MKNGIIKGGLWQLRRGQKKLSMEDIEKKYAKELAAAQPHQKVQIYQRMADDLSKQKNHKPSPYSLW